MNILHAWTLNFVNKLAKNPKHITPITFPSKLDIYHLHHKQVVTHLYHKFQTTWL